MTLRVLTVHPGPEFSVADVHAGWARALRRLGCEVVEFNLHDRLAFYESAGRMDGGEFVRMLDQEAAVRLAAKGLESACYEFWPDVVLVVSGFFVPPGVLDLLRSRGHRVVMLHTEEPYELGRELARAEHADVSLVNDPTHLERFQAIGPAWYAPHCYDPGVHFPGPPRGPGDVSEFCFVGTGYPSRIAFLEQCDLDGVDVALAGNWRALGEGSPLRGMVCHDVGGCIDNADAAWLYRGASMSANLYRREADAPELAAGWACGPREVEMAACGLAFLREPRGESDELFPMLPSFDGPGDFSEGLRWWLAHPAEREAAAAGARAAVADRTFEASAAGLLRALEKL